MDYYEFFQQTKSALPEGTLLNNPGGGTSRIIGYTHDKMIYKRGNSQIYVSMRDLYSASQTFAGRTVTKYCSENQRELEQWARQKGVKLQRCKTCM